MSVFCLLFSWFWIFTTWAELVCESWSCVLQNVYMFFDGRGHGVADCLNANLPNCFSVQLYRCFFPTSSVYNLDLCPSVFTR